MYNRKFKNILNLNPCSLTNKYDPLEEEDMSKVMTKKLSEIANVFTGVRIKRHEKGTTQTKQAIIHKSITQNSSKITPEEVKVNNEINEKYFTQENDIIYKLQGTTFGKRITNQTGLIVTHSFAIIRIKKEYNPVYVENFLNYPTIQNELKIIANESLIPQINVKTLQRLKIRIPSKEEQEKYAKITEVLDERIKTNQELIANDEEMKLSLISQMIGDNHE